MKTFLLSLALISVAFAAGTVRQSAGPIDIASDTIALAFHWTADASDGSVPLTPSTSLPTWAQGYFIIAGETGPCIPGTTPCGPNPSPNYSVQALDASGSDIFGGSAATVSATTGQAWTIDPGIPPLNGLLTLKVAGNSVNGAEGVVIIYLHRTPLRRGAAGPAGPGTAKRTCMITIGADNGTALADADIGPQNNQCQVPYGATVTEIDVNADAGTPSVIPRRRHCSTFTTGVCSAWTTANLVSGALAAAAGGFDACSNTGGTGLDGGTTCSSTLQNTALAQGDWVELASGTAGGTAKRLTIAIHFSVN